MTGDRILIHPTLVTAKKRLTPLTPHPSPALLETVSNIPNWIVHQDSDFLVLNKPQGLATQGGTGLKTSLSQALNLWLKEPIYLVHRLDKDTSGLLVVALNAGTAKKLSTLFQKRLVTKIYKAILVGLLPKNQGTHHFWVRKEGAREKMCIVSAHTPQAKEATCSYQVLKTNHHLSFVSLEPQTGRMHQLRVQMAHMSCPILGDGKYGGVDAHPGKRTTLHLHAESLSFNHPHTQTPQRFQAPLPPHFQTTCHQHHFCTDADQPTERKAPL